MTVPELIEQLRAIPGDSDLRTVRLRMELHRPYAKPTSVECMLDHVRIESIHVELSGWGWAE